MSRDKQIEEMAKDICHLGRKCPDCSRQAMCKAMNYASRFYAKGYRKSTDVAEEIFAEIENLFTKDNFRLICNRSDFAELKKKYESEKDNGKV